MRVNIPMGNKLFFRGNQSIWELPKTAFLCSERYSAGSVLRSYDWAAEMNRTGRCVISGFQSKLERDVLEILLRGSQPIIMALADGNLTRVEETLVPYIDEGRLLIMTIFNKAFRGISKSNAMQRNQYCIDVAEEVVFAHIHEGGMLSRLNTSRKIVLVLDALKD